MIKNPLHSIFQFILEFIKGLFGYTKSSAQPYVQPKPKEIERLVKNATKKWFFKYSDIDRHLENLDIKRCSMLAYYAIKSNNIDIIKRIIKHKKNINLKLVTRRNKINILTFAYQKSMPIFEALLLLLKQMNQNSDHPLDQSDCESIKEIAYIIHKGDNANKQKYVNNLIGNLPTISKTLSKKTSFNDVITAICEVKKQKEELINRFGVAFKTNHTKTNALKKLISHLHDGESSQDSIDKLLDMLEYKIDEVTDFADAMLDGKKVNLLTKVLLNSPIDINTIDILFNINLTIHSYAVDYIDDIKTVKNLLENFIKINKSEKIPGIVDQLQRFCVNAFNKFYVFNKNQSIKENIDKLSELFGVEDGSFQAARYCFYHLLFLEPAKKASIYEDIKALMFSGDEQYIDAQTFKSLSQNIEFVKNVKITDGDIEKISKTAIVSKVLEHILEFDMPITAMLSVLAIIKNSTTDDTYIYSRAYKVWCHKFITYAKIDNIEYFKDKLDNNDWNSIVSFDINKDLYECYVQSQAQVDDDNQAPTINVNPVINPDVINQDDWLTTLSLAINKEKFDLADEILNNIEDFDDSAIRGVDFKHAYEFFINHKQSRNYEETIINLAKDCIDNGLIGNVYHAIQALELVNPNITEAIYQYVQDTYDKNHDILTLINKKRTSYQLTGTLNSLINYGDTDLANILLKEMFDGNFQVNTWLEEHSNLWLEVLNRRTEVLDIFKTFVKEKIYSGNEEIFSMIAYSLPAYKAQSLTSLLEDLSIDTFVDIVHLLEDNGLQRYVSDRIRIHAILEFYIQKLDNDDDFEQLRELINDYTENSQRFDILKTSLDKLFSGDYMANIAKIEKLFNSYPELATRYEMSNELLANINNLYKGASKLLNACMIKNYISLSAKSKKAGDFDKLLSLFIKYRSDQSMQAFFENIMNKDIKGAFLKRMAQDKFIDLLIVFKEAIPQFNDQNKELNTVVTAIVSRITSLIDNISNDDSPEKTLDDISSWILLLIKFPKTSVQDAVINEKLLKKIIELENSLSLKLFHTFQGSFVKNLVSVLRLENTVNFDRCLTKTFDTEHESNGADIANYILQERGRYLYDLSSEKNASSPIAIPQEVIMTEEYRLFVLSAMKYLITHVNLEHVDAKVLRRYDDKGVYDIRDVYDMFFWLGIDQIAKNQLLSKHVNHIKIDYEKLYMTLGNTNELEGCILNNELLDGRKNDLQQALHKRQKKISNIELNIQLNVNEKLSLVNIHKQKCEHLNHELNEINDIQNLYLHMDKEGDWSNIISLLPNKVAIIDKIQNIQSLDDLKITLLGFTEGRQCLVDKDSEQVIPFINDIYLNTYERFKTTPSNDLLKIMSVCDSMFGVSIDMDMMNVIDEYQYDWSTHAKKEFND